MLDNIERALRNHRKAFKNDDYERDDALSEEVWNIKRKDEHSTIQLQKHQNFPSYTAETNNMHSMHE